VCVVGWFMCIRDWYCVATYGVTGARERVDETAKGLVEALRARTDLPLLVGVGIGTPSQAAEVSAFADGVVVGSALMARVVADDLDGTVALASSFRAAIPR
jgi:tryptophan synthase alpha chain